MTEVKPAKAEASLNNRINFLALCKNRATDPVSSPDAQIQAMEGSFDIDISQVSQIVPVSKITYRYTKLADGTEDANAKCYVGDREVYAIDVSLRPEEDQTQELTTEQKALNEEINGFAEAVEELEQELEKRGLWERPEQSPNSTASDV
jgi:hypothetical protein